MLRPLSRCLGAVSSGLVGKIVGGKGLAIPVQVEVDHTVPVEEGPRRAEGGRGGGGGGGPQLEGPGGTRTLPPPDPW